jgi:hypothetical protein
VESGEWRVGEKLSILANLALFASRCIPHSYIKSGKSIFWRGMQMKKKLILFVLLRMLILGNDEK